MGCVWRRGTGLRRWRVSPRRSLRTRGIQDVTKLINANIESIVASRAVQDSGRFTLRDIKEKGDTQLRVAKEMERKKSKKAKVERQKEELERKLREMRGE